MKRSLQSAPLPDVRLSGVPLTRKSPLKRDLPSKSILVNGYKRQRTTEDVCVHFPRHTLPTNTMTVPEATTTEKKKVSFYPRVTVLTFEVVPIVAQNPQFPRRKLPMKTVPEPKKVTFCPRVQVLNYHEREKNNADFWYDQNELAQFAQETNRKVQLYLQQQWVEQQQAVAQQQQQQQQLRDAALLVHCAGILGAKKPIVITLS